MKALLLAAALLGSAAANAVVVLSLRNNEYSVSLETYPDRQVIRFEGFIHRRTRELNRIVGKLDPGKDVVLSLDASGGDPELYDQAYRKIRRKLRGRLIVAHVLQDAICYSACIDWVLRADISLASPGAKFGFHGCTDHKNRILPVEASVEDYRKYGIPPAFLQSLISQGVFSRSTMTVFPGAEMKAHGVIGDLTDMPAEYVDYKRHLKLKCDKGLKSSQKSF